MSLVAKIFEKAVGVRTAGTSAFLALALGTAPDAANRIGLYADTTASAEQLVMVVGAQAGPAFLRSGSSVIATALKVQDSTFQICDNSDLTKTLAFQVGTQSSGFQLTIDVGAQAANRTLSVPVLTGNDTLTALNVANVFTQNQTVPNGSAAAPGIRLTSEASGLYRVSSTSLGFSVAGTAAASLTSGGVFSSSRAVINNTSDTATDYNVTANKTYSSPSTSGAYRCFTSTLTDASTATDTWYNQQFICVLNITGSGTNNGYDRAFVAEVNHRGSGTRATVTGFDIEVGTYNGGSDSTGTITTLRGIDLSAIKTASSTITTSVLLEIGANVGTTKYAIRTASTSGIVTIGDTTDASSSSAASVTLAGGLAVAKAAYFGTNGTFGSNTGAIELRVNGGNSGSNNGGRVTIWNSGSSIIQFGNKSAVLGGSYSATPYFYTNGTVEFSDSIQMTDAKNIVLTTTTGTKIGTSTIQKLGLWNATPVVQPSSTGETAGWTSGGGSAATSTDTYTGNVGSKAYTINDIVKHLKNLGALAAS